MNNRAIPVLKHTELNDKTDDFAKEIFADVDAVAQWLTTNDTMVTRRAYVRAVFAAIEGSLFIMRLEVLSQIAEEEYSLSAGDLSLLKEESYFLDDKTLEAKSTSRFVRMAPMLKYTFKHYSCVNCVDDDIDYSTVQWQSLLKAIEIRNRITHPKSLQAFTVTDTELQIVREGFNWFIGAYTGILVNALKESKRRIRVMKTHLKKMKSHK